MMYQDRQVIDEIYKRIPLDRILMKQLGKGLKLGGALAIKALMSAINKTPDNGINREGKNALNFLTNSKDDLSTLTIRKDQLQAYKEKFKEQGITFASIGDKRSDYVKILFKTKQEEKVAAIVDKMEEVANKLDEKQEKEAYDIMKNLDFREVGENVYRQNEIMTAEQIVSMKEELEKKGIKSEVVINKVLDDNKYEVDFKISMKDKEKVKKPLDLLIEKAIKNNKDNKEMSRSRRLEELYKSGAELTTFRVNKRDAHEFECSANYNGIKTAPIREENGKVEFLIKSEQHYDACEVMTEMANERRNRER